MRREAIFRWGAVAAIALLVTAACGSDDPPAAKASGTPANGDRTEDVSTSPDDGAVVEITAVEYTFQGVPDTVPAGTELALFNAGSEMHDLNVFFVGDETAPIEDLIPPEGAHIGVITALPGEQGVPAVVPGGGGPLAMAPLILERAGRYILYSTMNEGSDPERWREFLEANEDAGRDRGVPPPFGSGEPDFLKGMVAEIHVVGESQETVLDVLNGDDRFETVYDLLVNVAPPHFEGYLTGPSWDLTFLAPTDEAFDALPAGTLDTLRADEDLLTRVLDHHVVASYLTSAAFETGEVETIFGPLAVTVDADGVRFGDARVVEADIRAPNGVIHAIDAVLIPATIQEGLS